MRNFNRNGAVVNVGSESDFFDSAFVYGLKPNCLPDTRGCGVPETDGLLNLLASLLMTCVCRVKNSDNKFVFTVNEKVGYIKSKGVVAACVVACNFAVNPYSALPVNRIKVKKCSFTLKALVESELSAVPEKIVFVNGFADTRKSRFY